VVIAITKCLQLEIHHSHRDFECPLLLDYLLQVEPAMGLMIINLRGSEENISGQAKYNAIS
jgi:hypothetical protein